VPASAAAASPPQPSRVFLVVLENRELEEALGNPEAPYLEHLAEKGAVAVNDYGVGHPSLPNYLALFAGSTFGITQNCTECVVTGPNLATQLSRAGISWRAYMEGMPEPCYGGGNYGGYAKRHDPFAYFPSVMAVPRRCANLVPETRLLADLDRHRLPTFGWLTPDICNDGHDCGLAAVDWYLWLLLPRVIHQLGPHGLLVITFDEGRSDAGCCGAPGGGRIATLLVGPDVSAGREIRQPANHYSLLASIEDRFGLPRLGLAGLAQPLAPALFALGQR